MGQDFTSRNFPFITKYSQTDGQGESEAEPASEDVKTSVENYEHPLFSSNGSILTVNYIRGFANSIEEQLSGEVKDKTISDMVKAAYQFKFPPEMLMVAADFVEALTKRSGMGDANSIIQQISGYTDGFGRPPKNFELFMAYVCGGVGQAQQLIQKAQDAPNDKAIPIGTKYDDIIFYKKKLDEKVLRTNKEVVQFFMKRMINGTHFFPHLPLGQNANATN